MKRRIVSLIFSFLCIAAIAVGVCIFVQKQREIELLHQQEMELKYHDLQRISEESYDSVFLSMYPVNGYSEEDFAFYRGTDTIISAYTIPKLAVLEEYFAGVFSGANEVTNVFLGMDPAKIWESCDEKVEDWNAQLEEILFPYLVENPEVSFEVMLAYPDLEYWTAMSEKEMDTVLTVYRNLIYSLGAYENVTIYYLGAEEWLIANPNNYTAKTDINEVVAQKIFLYTFCDHMYQIDVENADVYFESLRTLVVRERSNPTEYPDLSKWHLVFFGDSVIGNYYGSNSVPGVLSSLSGADVYNYAIGGSQATDSQGNHTSFVDITESFLKRELEMTRDNTVFPYEAVDSDEADLCFLIHYGLNDYFNGKVVEDSQEPYNAEFFAGALRAGIKRLQEAYPNSVIILMTPPYCEMFEQGTMKNTQEGGVLADYVAAVERVAEELNVICMNNYEGLGITEENSHIYLEDGVHLNETGRFVLGKRIISVLEELK